MTVCHSSKPSNQCLIVIAETLWAPSVAMKMVRMSSEAGMFRNMMLVTKLCEVEKTHSIIAQGAGDN